MGVVERGREMGRSRERWTERKSERYREGRGDRVEGKTILILSFTNVCQFSLSNSESLLWLVSDLV